MSDWRAATPGDYAVVGDPVAHSWSPAVHRAAYLELGLDLAYTAVHVPAAEFEQALDHLTTLGYRGVNVTVPHKRAAYDWCADREGFCWGSVNAIKLTERLGTNTDVPAFLSTLASLGVSAPARVLLLGAGGTALALAGGLLGEGYDTSLWNRTLSRAQEAERASPGLKLVESPEAQGFDVVVNTTSAGLDGLAPPVQWGTGADLAYDVSYSAQVTPFLAGAIAAGVKACDGRLMLVEQAALSFEWWTSLAAPREAMLNALP